MRQRRYVRAGAVALCLSAMALAACQSKPAAKVTRPESGGKSAALRTMEPVAIAAHKCWFASKDLAFRPYRFANELNSFSGQPRFLLVPAKDFGGRPLLVVQASGRDGRLDAFGPLIEEGALAGRIRADLARWQAGSSSCGDSA